MSTTCPLRARMAWRGWVGVACKLLIRSRCRDFFDGARWSDIGLSYARDCWNEVLVKYVRDDLTLLFYGEPDTDEEFSEAFPAEFPLSRMGHLRAK